MDEVANRPAGEDRRSAGDALTGRTLGPYRILRELGRGSNGVVYEALRDDDHLRVALKVLPANITLNPKTVARFQREAQAAAGLRHDGIVGVREIDEDGGTHYFAMDYVEGVSLDRYAQSRDLSVREAVRLIRDAARALHFAHNHGVIHRDVKPSNLLVRADGEILVSDFGLARLEKSATLTSTDAIVGTPRYMSPEQILAEKGKVDQRTDVYALAVTLYELVTGDHPFEGESVQAFLRNVLESDPLPPRKKNRLVPRSVETIILKAMDRDLDRRYRTAADLADDLDRFLARKPVRARRPPVVPRMIVFVKRHRVSVLAGALIVTAATVAILVLLLRSGSAQLQSKYGILVRSAEAQLSELVKWSAEEAPARVRSLEETLAEAIHLRERRPEAFVLRGRLRWYQGRFEDAASDLAAARKRGAGEIETAALQAFVALREEDWPVALRHASIALDHGPSSAELLFTRGAARFAEGDAEGAEEDLRACLELDRGHKHALRLMGELLSITGESAEEMGNISRFMALIEQLGRASAESASALATITDLVSLAASRNPKLLTIGRGVFRDLVLRRELREEDAREEIEAATAEIEAAPANPSAYVRRGRARTRLGELESALGDFEKAIDIRQRDPQGAPDWEPYFWIAFVNVTSSNDDFWDEPTATSSARSAVQLAPAAERPRARDVYAEVMFRSGRKQDALEIIQALQIEDPERAEYYRRREAYFRG